jgi:hypothetical protein
MRVHLTRSGVGREVHVDSLQRGFSAAWVPDYPLHGIHDRWGLDRHSRSKNPCPYWYS